MRSTVNKKEIENFNKIASEWWNPKGDFEPLHSLNPLRLYYIKERIEEHFSLNSKKSKPLKKLSVLDVGCGGGLLCEPMSKLGAKVTGIDASKKNIAIAKKHAKENHLQVNYMNTTIENLLTKHILYDVILNTEIIEHVDNVDFFLESCFRSLKPGGIMFLSTINRTIKSFLMAIVGAEYVLHLLPIGTHKWEKFIQPNELEEKIKKSAFRVTHITGLRYNPILKSWNLTNDLDVNYLACIKK